jgi:azurin
MTRFLILTSALTFLVPGAEAAPRSVTITMTEPLRFDPLQVEVKPSEELVFKVRNTDSTEQPHNFVLAKPGSQKALVERALNLGAEGPARDFIPESDSILVHSKLLAPGTSEQIAFTAPAEPGVYPYVCTFPGHGFLMYGALYVGMKAPRLEKDPNIPPSAVQFLQEKNSPPKTVPVARPAVQRMFLPDAGPAAIAVALPGTLNYCWDAGACKLRYIWRGDFIDASAYWKGNGNAQAKVNGELLWSEGPEAFPLHLSSDPAVKFEGYRLIEGLPQFQYQVHGIRVYETITAKPDGSGLLRNFKIPTTYDPFHFLIDGGKNVTVHCEGARPVAGGFEIPDSAVNSFTIEMTVP